VKYTHTQLMMVFFSYSFLFFFLLVEWSSVGQSNMHCCREKKKFFLYINCLSAIRFRGGVILQVSCYTLLTPIPTSVATVLMSTPHGTPFRVYRKVGADMLRPCLSWERQVESLIARTAYQLWPTTSLWYFFVKRILSPSK